MTEPIESEDLIEINRIIDEKFGGSACRYLQARKDEETWKEQLEQLPLSQSDQKKFGQKIHEAAMECGGDPAKFEDAMADLFKKEIEPLTRRFVTGDNIWVEDPHSVYYNMSVSQAREYGKELEETVKQLEESCRIEKKKRKKKKIGTNSEDLSITHS